MTTGLLVSVRDRKEASDALQAGADLIDLKEPRHGPLGAVDSAVMHDALHMVEGRVPVSVALGELTDVTAAMIADVPRGISLVKFGLAGCGPQADWHRRLAAALAGLQDGIGGVAVVYADWQVANAPAPVSVLEHAARTGCRAVLVDTWRKGAGSLLDLWNLDECAAFVTHVHAAGLRAVLAGSLTMHSIELLLPLAPDYVAVRGAVCQGPRTGRLSAQLVTQLKHSMANANGASSLRLSRTP
ncbi:MAG TPA: (5-formylfuran-3-yl)methyl phosphate synthase [Pirellulales bacterium]|jgi:hypothetical protein